MKKILSLALALALCLSLSITAFASAHTLYVIAHDDPEYTNLAIAGDSGDGWAYDEDTNTLTLNGAKNFDITVNLLPQGAPTIVLAPGSKNVLTGLTVDALIDEEEMAGKDALNIKGTGELVIYNPNPEDYQKENGVFWLGFASKVNLQDGLVMTGGMKQGDSGTLTTKKVVDEWMTTYTLMSGNSAALYVHIAPAGGTTPVAPSTTGFTDVAAASPYAEAIKWAVDKGITTGKTATTFGPNDPCTISHAVTFLWRAAGRPEPSSAEYAGNRDQDKALYWGLNDAGFVDRLDDESDTCTRMWIVYALWVQAGSPTGSKAANFTDIGGLSEFEKDAINWAVEKGITTGKTATTFAPNDPCTRGQIVTFLYRASK